MTRPFDNGLLLVAEHMPAARSAAMTVLCPAGAAQQPCDQQAAAPMLAEMICRGAGELDAREHSQRLDQLGVERGTGVETTHLNLSARMLGDNLLTALPLLTDMIRRPVLAKDDLEPVRDLALQALDALEDEPHQKVFFQLKQQHLPEPFGRCTLGRRDDLERLTHEQLCTYHANHMRPSDTIIAVAGQFDWQALCEQIERLLGDWQGKVEDVRPEGEAPGGYLHVPAESTQVHIGLAYDAVPETDQRSVIQRAATAVLSGGMSGRLFTEVRERHGLCYAVFAAYAANRHLGAVLSYAGTTTARAQQTFDVLSGELRRLSDGVEPDEFDRAMIGMKSSLVMQGESTAARAGAIAVDQYLYGRPRSLDERVSQVQAVTLEQLNQFLRENPPGQMTVVTIGSQSIECPAQP